MPGPTGCLVFHQVSRAVMPEAARVPYFMRERESPRFRPCQGIRVNDGVVGEKPWAAARVISFHGLDNEDCDGLAIPKDRAANFPFLVVTEPVGDAAKIRCEHFGWVACDGEVPGGYLRRQDQRAAALLIHELYVHLLKEDLASEIQYVLDIT